MKRGFKRKIPVNDECTSGFERGLTLGNLYFFLKIDSFFIFQ